MGAHGLQPTRRQGWFMQMLAQLMADEADRRLPCYGRVSYATRGEAAQASARLKQRGPRRVEAYVCRWCGVWHVGSGENVVRNRSPGGHKPTHW